MSKAETNISNRIRIVLSAMGARVFRNHRGKHLTMDGKRIVTTGLAPGASDIIGWLPVTVTPAMVGKQLAVFVSIEVKTDDGRTTEEQDTWLDAVHQAGGIAFVARSPAEAEEMVAAQVRLKSRLAIRV